MDEDLKTLTELLDGIQDSGCRGEIEVHGRNYPYTISNEEVASHLIDNGVTVRRWIPVTEWLPSEYARWVRNDDNSIEPREFIAFIEGAEIPTVLYFNGESFCDDDGTCYSVTHWQPMPDGPRKEAGA